jgi:hypothetical protein
MSDVLTSLQGRSYGSATSATTTSYRLATGSPPLTPAGGPSRSSALAVRDSRPHAAISTYARRDATFWLPTIVGSVRERNLDAEPGLIMTVSEGDRGRRHVLRPASVAPPDRPNSALVFAATQLQAVSQPNVSRQKTNP